MDELFCSMSLHTDICHIKKGITVPIQSIRQSHDFFTFSKNLKKSRQIEKKINPGSKNKGVTHD